MKKTLILVLIISAVLLVACPKAPETAMEKKEGEAMAEKPATGNVIQVSIKDFKFVPADITVKEGDTVAWTNEDSVSHTVESDDGTVKSKELFQGDKFQFTFTKKGSYPYICGIHPSMKGGVTVE